MGSGLDEQEVAGDEWGVGLQGEGGRAGFGIGVWDEEVRFGSAGVGQ